MTPKLNVAVVGATGWVGRDTLRILEERDFPIEHLLALDAEHKVGETALFKGHSIPTEVTTPQAFQGMDLVLMVADPQTSQQLSPAAVQAGALVIDASSCWRMDPQVPLVIPEVNASILAHPAPQGIIASPSSVTIPLGVVLAPLHQHTPLTQVTVATYQAVSDPGQPGLDELNDQIKALYQQEPAMAEVFAKRVAFNCLPQVGVFLDDASTQAEQALVQETRKILGAPGLDLCATCVYVPVFHGHSLAVVARFEQPFQAATARMLLRQAPGVLLQDDPKALAYPTCLDISDEPDATYVGRVRQAGSDPCALALWCVVDNLRKGAATNLVQIAEIAVRTGLPNLSASA